MSASPLNIGWIGAGRMGAQLVTRLLDAGYDVTVYNRTASKAPPLADRGAGIASQASRSRRPRSGVLHGVVVQGSRTGHARRRRAAHRRLVTADHR